MGASQRSVEAPLSSVLCGLALLTPGVSRGEVPCGVRCLDLDLDLDLDLAAFLHGAAPWLVTEEGRVEGLLSRALEPAGACAPDSRRWAGALRVSKWGAGQPRLEQGLLFGSRRLLDRPWWARAPTPRQDRAVGLFSKTRACKVTFPLSTAVSCKLISLVFTKIFFEFFSDL